MPVQREQRERERQERLEAEGRKRYDERYTDQRYQRNFGLWEKNVQEMREKPLDVRKMVICDVCKQYFEPKFRLPLNRSDERDDRYRGQHQMKVYEQDIQQKQVKPTALLRGLSAYRLQRDK